MKLTPLMRQQCQRWLKCLQQTVGVSALRAVNTTQVARPSASTAFSVHSDTATHGVKAGLGGWFHGYWWAYSCSPAEAAIPIAVLEFVATLVSFFTFSPLLGKADSCKHFLHLRADALATPMIIATERVHSELIEEAHLIAIETAE